MSINSLLTVLNQSSAYSATTAIEFSNVDDSIQGVIAI